MSYGRTSTSVVYGRLQAASGRSVASRVAARSGRWPRNLACANSVLRRRVKLRGAGREPTAAARRPITQATLPSADHAAEIARLQRENERPRMERDILKKVDRDLCWGAEMRFRFIEDRRADYPVRILCDVLGVSPAGYYAWRPRPESQRSVANRVLVDDKRVHRETSGRY